MFRHQARSRFSQNFLIDQNIIHKIIQAIAPKPEDSLLEIGPGKGALTQLLINEVKRLDVVEIDRDLAQHLQMCFSEYANFHLHQGDALKFQIKDISQPEKKIRVVGNLPYNISTPLLFHLIKNIECIEDMYFMLQKEIVDRITASPGNKQYGRLTVMLQYYCKAEKVLNVGPNAFDPKPKVESAVLRLIPHATKSCVANDIELFHDVVNKAFNQRRKVLNNSLADYMDESHWRSSGVDRRLRPERLSVDDFVKISNCISDK